MNSRLIFQKYFQGLKLKLVFEIWHSHILPKSCKKRAKRIYYDSQNGQLSRYLYCMTSEKSLALKDQQNRLGSIFIRAILYNMIIFGIMVLLNNSESSPTKFLSSDMFTGHAWLVAGISMMISIFVDFLHRKLVWKNIMFCRTKNGLRKMDRMCIRQKN